MPASDPFSIRLPKELYERVYAVIAATSGEYNKTQIVVRALETYLALLNINPSLLEGYDRDKDTSVTHSDTL